MSAISTNAALHQVLERHKHALGQAEASIASGTSCPRNPRQGSVLQQATPSPLDPLCPFMEWKITPRHEMERNVTQWIEIKNSAQLRSIARSTWLDRNGAPIQPAIRVRGSLSFAPSVAPCHAQYRLIAPPNDFAMNFTPSLGIRLAGYHENLSRRSRVEAVEALRERPSFSPSRISNLVPEITPSSKLIKPYQGLSRLRKISPQSSLNRTLLVGALNVIATHLSAKLALAVSAGKTNLHDMPTNPFRNQIKSRNIPLGFARLTPHENYLFLLYYDVHFTDNRGAYSLYKLSVFSWPFINP